MREPHRLSVNDVEISNHWTEGELSRAVEIHRVEGKKASNVIILSHMVEIMRLHFYGGYTVPHSKSNCEACEDGIELRVRFYFAVQHCQSRVIECMELTKVHLAAAEEYERVYKTMRGCNLRAMRKNGENNGQLRTSFTASNIPESQLPPAFNVKAFLQRVFKLTRCDEVRNDPALTQEARRNRLNAIAIAEQNGFH